MAGFLKLILAFLPWIAFLVIAHGSLLRLKVGLVVGLVISLAMGIGRIHRGIILWAGLMFFVTAGVAVIGFDNSWVIRFMGVLASGTLAVATWISVLAGRPFTMAYARQHVDQALWSSPEFIRSNLVISSVWGASFSLNTVLAIGKVYQVGMPSMAYEAINYAVLIGTAAFTSWYSSRLRQRRIKAQLHS
ncbi:hypothetical protein [Synechococcus sp. CS-1328]|uniref:hypothetical protein n=1 Tax=Synechococcus sp. CS-1328 TaxID=2847976 RepID=UPI00223AB665|nr:hypothetical protein [Synechococcus sp. CS-1328]MCT0225482.1 hypothetical protein [Synechococcus sp. CS-1328]